MPADFNSLAVDWENWRSDWLAWRDKHAAHLELVPKAIPGKNFLADEILGTYRLPSGRTVELSEVTFPNLVERDAATGRLLDYTVRAIGLTWVDDRSGMVVRSFAELEVELGL